MVQEAVGEIGKSAISVQAGDKNINIKIQAFT